MREKKNLLTLDPKSFSFSIYKNGMYEWVWRGMEIGQQNEHNDTMSSDEHKH